MSNECRSCSGTTLTRTTKVLESDQGRSDASELRSLRVIGGERNGNARVVDSSSSGDVGIQGLQGRLDKTTIMSRNAHLNECGTIWRTSAGNFDHDACSVRDTIAVTGPGGVQTGSMTKLWHQTGVNVAPHERSRWGSRYGSDSSGQGESSGEEFHDGRLNEVSRRECRWFERYETKVECCAQRQLDKQ